MTDNGFFRVNAPDVLHETIDGEVVLVNMQSGAYYSIDRVGATIWDLLVGGNSADQITEVLTRRFQGDPDGIASSVRRLLEKLHKEGLVALDTEGDASPDGGVATSAPEAEELPRFEEPVLQKYTDMEQLLLLDPIHEVDETGWPTEKAAEEK